MPLEPKTYKKVFDKNIKHYTQKYGQYAAWDRELSEMVSHHVRASKHPQAHTEGMLPQIIDIQIKHKSKIQTLITAAKKENPEIAISIEAMTIFDAAINTFPQLPTEQRLRISKHIQEIVT